MNQPTNDHTATPQQPTDRAQRVAEQIRTSPTPEDYKYAALKIAAEDAVRNPAAHRMAELAAVLEGIRLADADQYDMVRRAAASLRGGEAR